MDLNSGQLDSRNIVHEIPVTDVVIKAVKNMAYQQGFKSLKLKNRQGVIYHDADWITGVDFDDPEMKMKMKMKMKNTTTKKTKTRTNSNNTTNARNNSSTSILKRSKTS